MATDIIESYVDEKQLQEPLKAFFKSLPEGYVAQFFSHCPQKDGKPVVGLIMGESTDDVTRSLKAINDGFSRQEKADFEPK